MQPPDEAARRRRHRNERIVAAIFVSILLVAVVAFIRWNEREEERFQQERTYIPKQVAMTPEIALLQEYVRIDTSNPPGDVTAGARWLAGVLARNGVRPEIIEAAPGRLNVYARIRGRRPGEGLLLLSHIDVVPADAREWDRPPFEGRIELGSLHGRGSQDMKGIAICHLAAFLDVARSGKQPERDLVFLAVADEETRGRQGMAWLAEHRRDLFDGVRYALGEGGITEMIAERMTYYSIEIGAKQYASLALDAPSEETLRSARMALEPYVESREPERILPGVRTYFRFIAPTRTTFRRILSDVDKAVAEGTFWELPQAYRSLTQTNVMMGWPQFREGRWRTSLGILMLPDEDPAERLEWARRIVEPLGVHAVVETVEPRTPLSTSDTPMFRLIASVASKEYGAPAGTLILHRATNDLRFLRRMGIECYGVLPYPVDAFESATIHGVNERIALERFVRGVKVMREIVGRWCGGG